MSDAHLPEGGTSHTTFPPSGSVGHATRLFEMTQALDLHRTAPHVWVDPKGVSGILETSGNGRVART